MSLDASSLYVSLLGQEANLQADIQKQTDLLKTTNQNTIDQATKVYYDYLDKLGQKYASTPYIEVDPNSPEQQMIKTLALSIQDITNSFNSINTKLSNDLTNLSTIQTELPSIKSGIIDLNVSNQQATLTQIPQNKPSIWDKIKQYEIPIGIGISLIGLGIAYRNRKRSK
jgi:hypothetical protein